MLLATPRPETGVLIEVAGLKCDTAIEACVVVDGDFCVAGAEGKTLVVEALTASYFEGLLVGAKRGGEVEGERENVADDRSGKVGEGRWVRPCTGVLELICHGEGWSDSAMRVNLVVTDCDSRHKARNDNDI